MKLEYPWVREELGYHLRYLSDSLWQWQAWIEGKYNTPTSGYSFTFTVQFMVDSGWFQGDVHDYLGLVLKTQEEVETITVLCAAICVVLDTVGSMASTKEKMTSPLWSDVISAAREALDAFSRAEYNGFPKKAE